MVDETHLQILFIEIEGWVTLSDVSLKKRTSKYVWRYHILVEIVFCRGTNTVPVLLSPPPLFDLPQPPVFFLANLFGLGGHSLFSPTKSRGFIDI